MTTADDGSTWDVVGRWLDETPLVGSTITIFREQGALKIEKKYGPTSNRIDDLIEKDVGGKTRYIEVGNEHGEYYSIDSRGNLGTYDGQGLITTAKSIR